MLFFSCVLYIILKIHGLPSGAPGEACIKVYPVGHGGTSQDLQENPYSLDLSMFDELGGTLYYVPEQTYGSKSNGDSYEGVILYYHMDLHSCFEWQ